MITKKIPFDLSKAKTFENPNGLEVVTTNNYPVTIVSTNYKGQQWGYTILGIVHLEDEDHPYTFNEHGTIAQDYIFKESLYLKEPIKYRKMTNQELSKWLREKPEEFREVTNMHNLIGSIHFYFEEYKNLEVGPDLMIRSNYGEWREPLIEIEEE